LINDNICFADVPLGLLVQGTIQKTTTYRLQRGNGHFGTVKGKLYQHKFPYTVSDPNCDHTGLANKQDFAQAVLNWQTTLTDSQKKEYNRRASKKKGLSGYCLYISDYRLGKT